MPLLAELCKLTGAKLHGDAHHEINQVADLESAASSDLAFLANEKYAGLLYKTKAGAICIDSNTKPPEGKNCLISEDPSRTFQQIAEFLLSKRPKSGFEGIHPTAVIHEASFIGKNVTIGPYTVIDQGAEIGDGCHIGPFVSIGPGVVLGINCLLYAHSVVREYCSLGNHVILQPGCVIGSCGFGYTTSADGEHTKLKQLGNVIIEDDVEIGANTTVDRSRFKTTRIGKGTKIDNLVQIAHNVELGEHNILCAQTGLAGSTKTGRNVMMGGQVGVVGHLEITDFVMIATRGGVSKSITKSGKYAGSPTLPLTEYNRLKVQQRNIGSFAKRIEALEKKLEALLPSCN